MVLSDIERKMLRIIGNYSAGRRRIPSVHELEIKTGRDRAGVMAVLKVLDQEGYIVWSPGDPESIELLNAWERQPEQLLQRTVGKDAWRAYGWG